MRFAGRPKLAGPKPGLSAKSLPGSHKFADFPVGQHARAVRSVYDGQSPKNGPSRPRSRCEPNMSPSRGIAQTITIRIVSVKKRQCRRRSSAKPLHGRVVEAMNLPEARSLLAEFVSPYRRRSRSQLCQLVGHAVVKHATGASGTEYRLELHVTLGPSRDTVATGRQSRRQPS